MSKAEKMSLTQIEPGSWVCDDRFLVDKKLGCGGFGVVYSGFSSVDPNLVALKFTSGIGQPPPKWSQDSDVTSDKLMSRCKDPFHVSLEKEFKAMQLLSSNPGFPRSVYFGSHEGYTVLAMELLGNSLQNQFLENSSIFSLPTLLKIVDKLLVQVELMHQSGIIHNDLKPDNILLGRESEDNNLYLIDFGLWYEWRDEQTGEHVKEEETKGAGTLRYCSMNCHRGQRNSRRDDLVSMCYVIADFVHHGNLPWSKTKDNFVGNVKLQYPGDRLFKGYPKVFGDLLDYALTMEFEEEPNYEEYRNRFRNVGQQLRVDYEGPIF